MTFIWLFFAFVNVFLDILIKYYQIYAYLDDVI